VSGDADRLQQVFWNLLQNAMKFTPPGGRILFHSYNRAESLCVRISDTGCGIEPAVLTKIFEPFEQGGRKSKEALQGLGLGLAISKRIITAHHGTLSAASEGMDRGAVFTLELKTVPAPPGEPSAISYQPELTTQMS
jgi:signal transduction histidine kinase